MEPQDFGVGLVHINNQFAPVRPGTRVLWYFRGQCGSTTPLCALSVKGEDAMREYVFGKQSGS
jgi:hypothetical protein